MSARVTSIRMTEELYRQVDGLARATGRNKSYLLTEAISRYVEEEAWQIQAVDEGIQSAETEPLSTHAEVVADLLQRGLVTEESLAAARERLADA
jgi:predicted transcriptional regulator